LFFAGHGSWSIKTVQFGCLANSLIAEYAVPSPLAQFSICTTVPFFNWPGAPFSRTSKPLRGLGDLPFSFQVQLDLRTYWTFWVGCFVRCVTVNTFNWRVCA
jgi:hypothetical protein